MPAPRTPPHLAQPQLTYASEGDDSYLTAIVQGFHEDFVADQWEAERKVTEWERCFGFTVEDRWIATCGAYSRVMTVPGGQLPVAAVSIVTVAPPYRRRGLLNQMMKHQLEDVQRREVEPVALLWASESLIYGRYGYGNAAPRLIISGPTRTLSFRPGVSLGAGSVDEVSQEEFLAGASAVHADLVGDRPGALTRTPEWWGVKLFDPEAWRRGAGPLRFALHFGANGEVDGYATFRVAESNKPAHPGREVRVIDLDAARPDAYAALWRFLLDLDLVRSFSRRIAPVDEPLRYLVADQRAVASEVLDGTYARIVDVPAALAARGYSREVDLVIELTDHLLPANAGRWRVRSAASGAQVNRTDSSPDVTMDIRELGAGYLGGTSFNALLRAGLFLEHTAGAVAQLAAAFSWPSLPFCPDEF